MQGDRIFKITVPSLSVNTPSVLFDISRLFRSRNKAFGTGVDRIDLAIGRDLYQRFGANCHFLLADPTGFGLLPQRTGRRLLHHLESIWNSAGSAGLWNANRTMLTALVPVTSRLTGAQSQACSLANTDTTYVVASHSGLGRVKSGLKTLDPAGRMPRLVYLHDFIPIDFPEYQRPQTAQVFQSFLKEVSSGPISLAVNSRDTAERARRYAEDYGWKLDGIEIATPGLKAIPTSFAQHVRDNIAELAAGPRPYFVILGTIEPRKNHLLLLNLWRELAKHDDAPRLIVIGRRGWENENVLDMLDRCPAFASCVSEYDDLSNKEVQLLLRGARALLFPSFAEGLGLPLLEATAFGTPCVVSDIAAFREFAPPGTVFLSPIDGLGWMRAILELAAGAPRRLADA